MCTAGGALAARRDALGEAAPVRAVGGGGGEYYYEDVASGAAAGGAKLCRGVC